MYDVVALGELLVDFTPCGVSAQELPVYQANPGGAPCNVLSMLSRLGRRCADGLSGCLPTPVSLPVYWQRWAVCF